MAWWVTPFAMTSALFLAMLYLQYLTEWSWMGYTRASCFPFECYCEAVTFGPIEQISNTYSNLPFLLVGLLIFFAPQGSTSTTSTPSILPVSAGDLNDNLVLWLFGTSPELHRNTGRALISAHWSFRWLYAASVCAMGFGSLFYHGSLILVAKFCDWFGMFLFAGYLVVYNVARLRSDYSLGNFFARYFLLNVILVVAILTLATWIRSVIFFLLLAAATLTGVYVSWMRIGGRVASSRYAVLAGLFIAMAFSAWLLDSFGIWCSSQSFFQGHALWHALAACSCGLIYLYFRSEQMEDHYKPFSSSIDA